MCQHSEVHNRPSSVIAESDGDGTFPIGHRFTRFRKRPAKDSVEKVRFEFVLCISYMRQYILYAYEYRLQKKHLT